MSSSLNRKQIEYATRILPRDCALWGILHSVKSARDGLMEAEVGGSTGFSARRTPAEASTITRCLHSYR